MIIQHDDLIEWPNGMGYTPCSSEYAAAIGAAEAARDEWHEVADDSRHPEYAARYEAMCATDAAVVRLQALGGHMGAPVRYAVA